MSTESFCSKLERFRDLQKIDDQLCDLIKRHIHAITQIKGWGVRSNMTGSVTEGAISARMFCLDKEHDEKITKEIEADIEFVYCDFTIQCKDAVVDIAGKPGYAKIKVDKKVLDLIEKDEFRKHAEDAINEEGYISSNKLKEIFSKNSDFDYGILKFIMSSAMDVRADEVKLNTTSYRPTKSSITSSVEVYVHDKYKACLTWDVIIAVKLPWWPSVANEWVNRKRAWPNKDLAQELTEYAYMITKPSDDEKENDSAVENRYSFSCVERKLSELYTKEQKLVYLIAKSIFYRWLKPFDPENVSSFLAKTIMCWLVEEYPPGHMLWEDASILCVIQLFFAKFEAALTSGHLEYYFIPEINVLRNISEDVRMKLLEQTRLILKNTVSFVPDNIEEVIEHVNFVRHVAEKSTRFWSQKSHGRELFNAKETNSFTDFPLLLNALSPFTFLNSKVWR